MAGRPVAVIVCTAVATLEALALVVMSAGLAFASFNTEGSRNSAAPIVEIIIYLAFAVALFFIARGIARGNSMARSPFVVAQVFALVVAWTLFQGDGFWVNSTGALVALVALIGLGGAVAAIRGEQQPSR